MLKLSSLINQDDGEPTETIASLGLSKDALDKVRNGATPVVMYLRMVAIAIAKKNGVVTSDAIRRFAEDNKIEGASSVLGSVFRAKGFKLIGEQPSTVASNKGRRISVWEWSLRRAK